MENELQKGKVAQGYLSTVMKGRFTQVELRFFMYIVQRAQDALDPSKKLKDIVGTCVCADGVHVKFSLPASALISDASHNYQPAKDAMHRLMKKTIEHWDYQKNIIKFTPIIYEGVIEPNTGYISFEVSRWVLDVILDFSKGFSLYFFKSAMSLKKAASMRLYMLLCNQRGPVVYSLKFLKEMFGSANAYKQNSDFIRRIITPAKDELEQKGLNGFEFKTNIKKKKIDSITFIPVKREEEPRQSVMNAAPLHYAVPTPLQNYLKTQCNFRESDIARNKVLLYDLTKLPNWQDLLLKIVERARQKRAGNGYIINAIKGEVSK